ncbi:MAG TPA: uroporphyrinogen decarboxylase family protein [Sumerlaeia bacterium]|nr:uroporphyrinogen decarboxylase family protein [Sumerlaeia bacterium]
MPETPLSLDQMRRVVQRRGGDIPRVPLFWHKFYNAGTVEKYGEALTVLNDSIVDDCISLWFRGPGNFQAPEGAPPEYKWAIEPDPGDLDTRGITSRPVVSSTDLIDDFIQAIPDPSDPAHFDGARQAVRDNPGRYCVAWDFFCLFERTWFLFGMEETLCEMMWRPDRIGRLFRAFCDYHKKVVTGCADAGAHAYFTSDDLGTQTGLIFSRDLFRNLYLPFYEELVDHCHSAGMHFWLHSCGAITDVVEDLVSIGVDVLHPIQPVAMDQEAIARKYRGRISFLAGIDVQRLLPNGSVKDVEEGARGLIDAFDSEEGGCILAASNGIMPETPLENIEAWLRTAQCYGRIHRASFAHGRPCGRPSRRI